MEAREAAGGLIAGNQRRVDGADRGADYPVGLDAGLMQRLVDARLVGAKRTATLEHEHNLLAIRSGQASPAGGTSVRRSGVGHGLLLQTDRPTAPSIRLRSAGPCR